MQPSEFNLRLATRHLRRGGLIAYPTEAVFGLGCDPRNETAIVNLLEMKHRSAGKGLILIAAHFDLIAPYIDLAATPRLREINATWPGPTTWLLPANRSVSQYLRGEHSTIAVRITNHPTAAAISANAASAIVSTSANKTGFEPARTSLKVRQYFKYTNLLIIPGATGGLAQPSAIYDAISGRKLR